MVSRSYDQSQKANGREFKSKNPMLDQLIQNKPRLILLSKKDKADKEVTKQWVSALETENQKVLALDFIH